MLAPEQFRTADEPLWTNADWARLLRCSKTYVSKFIKQGDLTPQRYTLGGRPLFEPEYVKWALLNSERIKRMMSERRVE